jgi:hypothetical protein
MVFTSPFLKQSQGAPIVYGDELVSDPYLGNENILAVLSGGVTVSKITAGDPTGFSSFIRCTAGDSSYERIELTSDVSFEVDKRYLITSLVRTGSVSGSEQGYSTDPTFNSSSEGYQYIDQTLSGWQWLIQTYTAKATTGTPRIYINRNSGSADDYVDIAYLSIREVGI